MPHAHSTKGKLETTVRRAAKLCDPLGKAPTGGNAMLKTAEVFSSVSVNDLHKAKALYGQSVGS
jgi:hypothetical protein